MTTPAPEPENPIKRSLAEMRAIIGRLEALGIPAVSRLMMDLRHQMIDLTARLNAMETDAAAKRMTGEAEPLKRQAPIDDTPLFALAASSRPEPSPSAQLLGLMDRAHWREGDHTQDREEPEK